MSMKGMDIEQAEKTVGTLKDSSGAIESAMTTCTQAMEQFDWQGEDAMRTKESWNSDYVTMLRQVIEALSTFAELINKNKEEQVGVSS